MTWLAAVGQKADLGGGRLLRGEASMSIATGPTVIGRWADVAAGAGYETSRLFGPFWGGLALTSLPLLERSGWSYWTGSRGPVRETGGGLALAPCPLMGRSGRSDGTGSREPGGEDGGLALTPCPLVGGPAGPTGPVHADRCGRRGGHGSVSHSLLLQDGGGGHVPRP